MAITSVGAGSGLELEDLINNIVKAERTPSESRLDLKEARATATISALGLLKSSMADLQQALKPLQDTSRFNNRSATSSNASAFEASAEPGAELGRHTIEVLQLAQAHKLASAHFSDPTAILGHGTLTLGVGDQHFDVIIEEGVNDTLSGIRDAINNAADNTGVRASLLTVSNDAGGTETRLVLTSQHSGTSGAITIHADPDSSGLGQLAYSADEPGSMTTIDAAQDARITIDGFVTVSATNTFTNVIDGVTLTALQAGEDAASPLTGELSITQDKRGIKAGIESFVAHYNALITVFNELTDYNPQNRTRGLLGGDASINVMEARIRGALGGLVEGAARDFNSLAFLGIATNKDGSISLDDATLTQALEQRYDDVTALFAGEHGVATRLGAVLGQFTASDGAFAVREDSLQKQLRSITDQREKLDLRMDKLEARYRSQFAALDILVTQLNQTGDFLLQQLEATAQIISPRRK